MRQALRQTTGRRLASPPKRVSTGRTLPAPVEGWDTETPFNELPVTRAGLLDNWIPSGTTIAMRRGYVAHVTGISAAITQLMAYSGSGSSRLFAATETDVYDVTAAGAVGAAVQSSLTNGRWSYVNISTSGGSFLWMCNGADDPRHWNGSAWAVPSLTMPSGLTDNDIRWVAESKQRLFFALNDRLGFGYLPVESIAGTVSYFSLGSVFSRGGVVVAITTMTHDGGAGPDDYTVFLTDQGEVAVYQGSNPGDATDWALVGRFYAGEPCGWRPFVDLDGDVGVIAVDGVIPVSQIFSPHEAVEPPRALTARVSTPYRTRSRPGQALPEWQGLYYPAGGYLLINVASTTGAHEQYVRAQASAGWSRFTGQAAAAWIVYGAGLYFGDGDGGVWRADTGHADDGDDIAGTVQTAWSSLGSPGVVKRLTAVRPIVTTETGAEMAIVARTDFRSEPAIPEPDAVTLSDALIWGVGLWNVAVWGGRDEGARQWRSLAGVGHHISIVIRTASNRSPLALQGIDLLLEAGGAL